MIIDGETIRTAPAGYCVLDGQVRKLSEVEAELRDAWLDLFFIPNYLIPESYEGVRLHNDKEWTLMNDGRREHGGSALAISKKIEAVEANKAEKQAKQQAADELRSDKDARIAAYAAAVEAGEPIEYDTDEDSQYRHQLAWMAVRVRAGLESFEE